MGLGPSPFVALKVKKESLFVGGRGGGVRVGDDNEGLN